MKRLVKLTLLALLFASPFLWLHLARPVRAEQQMALFAGITYTRLVYEEPRPLVIHVAEIDLTAVSPLITPAHEDGTYTAQSTSQFLQKYDLQLAMNGSFYRDVQDGVVEPVGLVVSAGAVQNNSRTDWPVLCFYEGVAQIEMNRCAAGVEQAIAGNVRLVENGRAFNPRGNHFPGRGNSFQPEPRTAVALDESGTRMWWVVVDGRQPKYSEGVTLAELAQFLADLGVHTALNLDGGGSSTLVMDKWWGTNTLNAPIHNRIPTRERPIATHIGLYARPLKNTD